MAKKVLVVEDDQDILNTVKEILENANYTVECATNGQEALEWLHSTSELPALIILDLKMPKMDGFTFTQEQKNDSKISNVPVLVMTANGNIDTQKYRIRAEEILKKPLELHSFLKTVKRLCS